VENAEERLVVMRGGVVVDPKDVVSLYGAEIYAAKRMLLAESGEVKGN
jgi:hypothetical protein